MLTEDGFKPISQIRKGDKVLAYDEATGTTGYFPVEQVWAHVDLRIEYLTLDGETVTTTPEHPFFTKERGWVAAGALWRGAHIRKADGSYGTVEKIEIVQRAQTMYNLTVSEAHTFFVGVEEWLVHNDCPLKGVPSGACERLLIRLKGIRGVIGIEAFGSRAGSTFRGSGPRPDSDLDMLIILSQGELDGRSGPWIRQTIGTIMGDFTDDTGIKVQYFVFDMPKDVQFFKHGMHPPFIDLY